MRANRSEYTANRMLATKAAPRPVRPYRKARNRPTYAQRWAAQYLGSVAVLGVITLLLAVAETISGGAL